MLTTVMPTRLRFEPTDMRAYDQWQDWEGMQDAPDRVRQAWDGFGPRWREMRNAELEKERRASAGRREMPLAAPVPDSFWRAHSGQDDALVEPYRRFRDRVRLSGGRSLWWAYLALGQGEPIAAVALGHHMEARYLSNATVVLARWWREALG